MVVHRILVNCPVSTIETRCIKISKELYTKYLIEKVLLVVYDKWLQDWSTCQQTVFIYNKTIQLHTWGILICHGPLHVIATKDSKPPWTNNQQTLQTLMFLILVFSDPYNQCNGNSFWQGQLVTLLTMSTKPGTSMILRYLTVYGCLIKMFRTKFFNVVVITTFHCLI